MSNQKKSWIKSVKLNPKFRLVGDFLQDLVDGNILVRKSFRKQYMLMLMFGALCIVYIGNRYTCDYNARKQRELVKDIEDRRYELLSISAELTVRTKGSVIEDSVKANVPELEIARVPSFIIE